MITWDDIKTPVTVIGGLLGILGALEVRYSAIRKWITSRTRVKRITASDDPDFPGVCELHKKLFGINSSIADDEADLQRWVDESEAARQSGKVRFEDILLCLGSKTKVMGYLYAQYYLDSKLVFVSYLGVDKESLDAAARKDSWAALKLVNCLLDHLKTYEWRGMVAEIEEFEKAGDGGLRPYAKTRMALFQRILRAFCTMQTSRLKSSTFDLGLYRIGIEYKQPILRPEELGHTKVDETFDQWLLYLARNKKTLQQTGSKLYMDKTLVLDVMRLILLETYLDAFENDEKYKSYLQSEYDKYAAAIPEKVVLAEHWREAEAAPRSLGAAIVESSFAT